MADTLSDLSKEAKRHWAEEQWGAYRNVRYEAAEHERRNGEEKRAAYLYLEVMMFDLQGVTGATDGQKFNRAYRRETPSVARELARFCLRKEVGPDELESMYQRVVGAFWVDAFPRSRDEVWQDLRESVEDHRVTLRLREKASAIGPDRLLPAEEAKAFARRADDYEVLRRVGTLLEGESPTGIPWRKRKRAHEYLSSVDIGGIGDRWRGKAFRWAGEVVLANGEKRAALDYLEKALEVVGRDDRAAVERLAGMLRRTLNGQEQ
jgi:hypothetical protein